MNNNDNKFKYKIPELVLTLSLAALSKLVAISFVVGSIRTFFSAVNVMGPLTVVFGGLPGGAFFLLLNVALGAKITFLLAGTGLPNFLAGCYWRSESKLFKMAVPLTCMALFWTKTWGTIAAPYALLWLVSIIIALLEIENILGKALGATFVAHAVGSVIWLYFAQVTNVQWFALWPIALGERILLASLMVAAYYFIQFSLTNVGVLLKARSKVNLRSEGAIL